ncbi:hypothetical protein [Bradyrhizobium sp. UNPA324]|uniref:hypothetical protein n=1 Tax=Bradyrhizobium sp. UNPA324 TaxID=1141174 RepID=UPI00114F7C9F|nr:hypothetical protein [Bradyrhizobium sp. UNPA324]TQF29157.1 hypothetical protein UNPA324_05515 [Bradyrhizobium sp. UNPA324]
MPKSTEIIAVLADTSGIDSEETLRAEMVDLFTDMAERMGGWSDKRPALIMRKMAATIDGVPHDLLAELGHSYNPTLICYAMLLHVVRADAPDYADAHDLVETLLDELRGIDLDHPDTQRAIEEIEALLESLRRPTG